MVTTKKQRMVVDIGMVCLLPLLMAYSLIGELFHEVIGTLMMILMSKHLYTFIQIPGISALMRQIAEYMFMRTMFVFFDFSENRIRFLADYLTVMVFFAMLGLIATAVLSSSKEKKEKGDL